MWSLQCTVYTVRKPQHSIVVAGVNVILAFIVVLVGFVFYYCCCGCCFSCCYSRGAAIAVDCDNPDEIVRSDDGPISLFVNSTIETRLLVMHGIPWFAYFDQNKTAH